MELTRAEVDKLIVQHSPQVFRVLHRFCGNADTAQDFLQDTIVKALSNYRTVKNPELFKQWFIVIAVNHARNRSRRKGFETPTWPLPQLADDKISPDELVLQLLTMQTLIDLSSELPERQRQAFLMRFFGDLSFKEIADNMGCAYDTAKANYRHAVTKIYAGYWEKWG